MIAVLLSLTMTAAQPPVDCSRLTTKQAAGQNCALGAPKDATVLQSDPECFDPYGLGQCLPRTPNAPAGPVTRYEAGHCYQGAYPSYQVRVNATGASVERAGATLVWGEFIPRPGWPFNVGPIAFYTDAPPMPLFEMRCPAR